MHIEHANRIPMAEILGKLLIQPKRVSSNKLRYSSPLHQEKTARFDVNTKTNHWYDHQQGISGYPVDFVCAYLKYTHEPHTEADALRWLKNMVVSLFEITPIPASVSSDIEAHSTLMLKTKKPIDHLGLIHYLEKRGIPLAIARQHLKEIRVYNTQTKQHFIALGLPNEEGGFDLNNPFFKGCIGPQAITFIRGRTPKPTSIHLFKNVMDYLSAISQLADQQFRGDTIILNSLSYLKQIIPYIQNYGYQTAYSWMDNDEVGEKVTASLARYFKTQDNLGHIPMNKIYASHKDVNAWHKHQKGLDL